MTNDPDPRLAARPQGRLSLLVTGGCGFIGANFIHFVRRHRPDWSIVNLDCLSYAGNLENLAGLENDDTHSRAAHGAKNSPQLPTPSRAGPTPRRPPGVYLAWGRRGVRVRR